MQERAGLHRWGFGALLALLLGLYAILPSLNLEVFNSPDETAHAVSAERIVVSGGASVAEPLAVAYPWLHPRSWITSGEKIVPVGFLGWSWFLSLWTRILGVGLLPWVGVFIILSSTVPFYKLLRDRFSASSTLAGTLVTFTFPSVLLYANRSLFPNLSVIALGLWSVWLLRKISEQKTSSFKYQKIIFSFLIGLICALALAMRPYEALWLIPWWVWAGWKARPNRWMALAACVGALLIAVQVLFAAKQTYGSFFSLGYWLRDNPMVAVETAATSVAAVPVHVSLLPYGFHPRNIWWNVQAFLFGLLLPWTVLSLIGFAWFLKTRGKKMRVSAADVPWLLGLWTVAVVVLAYGNGLYSDHVRLGAVTIGNSFLRYVLPMAPIVGWVIAWMFEKLPRPFGKMFGVVVLFGVVGFGGWRALAADDEGLLATRVELQRYAEIRAALPQWFHLGDVILSERSDKIAFPNYRAVSPLPPSDEVGKLAHRENVSVGLFIRPLTQAQKDDWRKAGLEVQELAVFGREKLYRLVPR